MYSVFYLYLQFRLQQSCPRDSKTENYYIEDEKNQKVMKPPQHNSNVKSFIGCV